MILQVRAQFSIVCSLLPKVFSLFHTGFFFNAVSPPYHNSFTSPTMCLLLLTELCPQIIVHDILDRLKCCQDLSKYIQTMSESREKHVPGDLQPMRQSGGLGLVFCCYFLSSNKPRS